MIPLPTRAGRWQMVWQGPRLGSVAETGRFVAMETPWVRFSYLLFLCLASYLPFFVFPFRSFPIFSLDPGMFTFEIPRVPSSVQQPSTTLSKYVFYSTCSFCLLCHLYPTPSRNSLFFFFRSSKSLTYLSDGVFLSCFRTRYASA